MSVPADQKVLFFLHIRNKVIFYLVLSLVKETYFFQVKNKPHDNYKFCALILKLGVEATVIQ
jgi:hypothetical protein